MAIQYGIVIIMNISSGMNNHTFGYPIILLTILQNGLRIHFILNKPHHQKQLLMPSLPLHTNLIP